MRIKKSMEINEIDKEINEIGWSDHNGRRALLIGSTDQANHNEIEILYKDVLKKYKGSYVDFFEMSREEIIDSGDGMRYNGFFSCEM